MHMLVVAARRPGGGALWEASKGRFLKVTEGYFEITMPFK